MTQQDTESDVTYFRNLDEYKESFIDRVRNIFRVFGELMEYSVAVDDTENEFDIVTWQHDPSRHGL